MARASWRDLARLAMVSRALNLAHAAYATALEERDVLRGQLEAYAVKAARGESVQANVDTGTEMVTKDNVGQFK